MTTDFEAYSWKGALQYECMDLHTACALGDYDCVKSHSEKGTNINRLNVGGWSPLMYAAFMGKDTVVNFLLETGVCEVNARGTDGSTALMRAVGSGNESVTYFLLQQKVDLEIVDYSGKTALFYASASSHQNVVKLLLDAGANIEAKNSLTGYTPLLETLQSGSESIVRTLLDYGANLSAVTLNKETARMLASRHSNYMTMLNLIDECTRKSGAPESGPPRSSPGLRSEAGLVIFEQSPAELFDIRTGPSNLGRAPTGLFLEDNEPKSQNIQDFLTSLGYEKFIPLFQKEGVSFERFLGMHEDDLKQIGITAFGPRRKIHLAIMRWHDQPSFKKLSKPEELLHDRTAALKINNGSRP